LAADQLILGRIEYQAPIQGLLPGSTNMPVHQFERRALGLPLTGMPHARRQYLREMLHNRSSIHRIARVSFLMADGGLRYVMFSKQPIL